MLLIVALEQLLLGATGNYLGNKDFTINTDKGEIIKADCVA